MAETFNWPEGTVFLWTGSATASAIVAYCQGVQGTFTRGWDNYFTISGQGRDTLTGERADITFNTLYSTDNSALRTFDASKTAVHMHLRHTGLGASAGFFIYSGRIDTLGLAGTESNSIQFSVVYHANVWSAYG